VFEPAWIVVVVVATVVVVVGAVVVVVVVSAVATAGALCPGLQSWPPPQRLVY